MNPRRKATVTDWRLGYLKRIVPRDPNKQMSKRNEVRVRQTRVPRQWQIMSHAEDRTCNDNCEKVKSSVNKKIKSCFYFLLWA